LIVRGYRRLRPWLERLEHDEMAGSAVRADGVHHLPTFLGRLIEETARAERYQLEYGVVVLRLPPALAASPERMEIEAALRSSLRRGDIPGRLSEELLAVLLPETGRKAPDAARRIARLLSETAGTAISAGYARYPADAVQVSDLIRIATARCAGAELPEVDFLAGVGLGTPGIAG